MLVRQQSLTQTFSFFFDKGNIPAFNRKEVSLGTNADTNSDCWGLQLSKPTLTSTETTKRKEDRATGRLVSQNANI
jgi:hypothetical protein